MKAGEVRPYFESLQTDLEHEADPQLRSWYEMEMSLTPDHKEATALQEKLGHLHGLLSGVIESAVAGESAAEEAPTEALQIDELIEIDEYVTPEEKKRRSVLAWLDTVLEDYQKDTASVQQEMKRSKREKQEALAARRFARNFERFGTATDHIVYDPDSLAIVLEELLPRRPLLAEAVVQNSEAYMHQNGVEFAKNSPAFARLIQHSTDVGLHTSFDRIFSAIYEKVPYLQDPIQASSLYISLANAALEVFEGKTHDFYHKVAETMDLKNGIIRRKSEYVAASESVATVGLALGDELQPFLGELWNARLVNSQFKQAFLVQQSKIEPGPVSHAQFGVAGRSLGRKYGGLDRLRGLDPKDPFLNRPQHAEGFDIFDLETGELLPVNFEKIEMPKQLRPYFYAAELYKKRKAQLAPRGLAHDFIRATIQRGLSINPDRINVMDIPISPGLAITYGTNLGLDELLGANDAIITKLIGELGDKLKGSLYQATEHESIARFGHWRVDLSTEGRIAFAEVVLRPTIPDDVLLAGGPYSSLATSFRQDVRRYHDPVEAATHHDGKLAHIANNRNHYPGRRPILFRLPDHYRERGLQAIEIRQHPDRSHVYVSAIHEEGRMEFVLDENFRIDDDPRKASQNSAVLLAFQDLVITLATEWCCSPVIETSEGRVSVHEPRSKVNLGFLRYLGVGQGFSERQRKIFAKEQRGNLAAESLRRKAVDPEGLGRNSTYVRENYDPNKPPLEVFYDPAALAVYQGYSA